MRRLFLLSLVWLASCATVHEGPLSERNYQASIAVGGRLSVRYDQDGSAQSLQGKFHWKQHGERTDIALYSPLGQTIATIAITPELSVMTQSGGEQMQAPDVTALTQQVLGWPMPVDGLRFWLQGFAQSADGKLQIASPEGRQSFASNGWQVRYVSWQRTANILYPQRIDIERTTAEAGQIVLRLVIDDWQEP